MSVVLLVLIIVVSSSIVIYYYLLLLLYILLPELWGHLLQLFLMGLYLLLMIDLSFNSSKGSVVTTYLYVVQLLLGNESGTRLAYIYSLLYQHVLYVCVCILLQLHDGL